LINKINLGSTSFKFMKKFPLTIHLTGKSLHKLFFIIRFLKGVSTATKQRQIWSKLKYVDHNGVEFVRGGGVEFIKCFYLFRLSSKPLLCCISCLIWNHICIWIPSFFPVSF
jgi:hypothetical protein